MSGPTPDQGPGPAVAGSGDIPRGGCLNLGWGCLPILVLLALPGGLWLG